MKTGLRIQQEIMFRQIGRGGIVNIKVLRETDMGHTGPECLPYHFFHRCAAVPGMSGMHMKICCDRHESFSFVRLWIYYTGFGGKLQSGASVSAGFPLAFCRMASLLYFTILSENPWQFRLFYGTNVPFWGKSAQ